MSIGFARQGRPNVSPPVKAPLVRFIAEEEIAIVRRSFDPFLVEGLCPHNAGGPHQPIRSCDEIVCCHCSTVFWR